MGQLRRDSFTLSTPPLTPATPATPATPGSGARSPGTLGSLERDSVGTPSRSRSRSRSSPESESEKLSPAPEWPPSALLPEAELSERARRAAEAGANAPPPERVVMQLEEQVGDTNHPIAVARAAPPFHNMFRIL